MNVSQALDDIKTYLEGDPLIQAAANLTVPASTRQILADHLLAVEADVAEVSKEAAGAAAEQARADFLAEQTPPAP